MQKKNVASCKLGQEGKASLTRVRLLISAKLIINTRSTGGLSSKQVEYGLLVYLKSMQVGYGLLVCLSSIQVEYGLLVYLSSMKFSVYLPNRLQMAYSLRPGHLTLSLDKALLPYICTSWLEIYGARCSYTRTHTKSIAFCTKSAR